MIRPMGLVVLSLLILGTATTAAADDAVQAPLRDPWVPPATRKEAVIVPPVRGEALRAKVEQKLRAAFDAADVQRTGSLTREQAQAGGLGLIAQNFERIDVAGVGRVTFDDFHRFLRARGADL